MKNRETILRRIDSFHDDIKKVEEDRKKEMEKHFSKRDFRMLFFYNREISVYEFAIHQLQWILSEDNI